MMLASMAEVRRRKTKSIDKCKYGSIHIVPYFSELTNLFNLSTKIYLVDIMTSRK